jgi:hypothetical protein
MFARESAKGGVFFAGGGTKKFMGWQVSCVSSMWKFRAFAQVLGRMADISR